MPFARIITSLLFVGFAIGLKGQTNLESVKTFQLPESDQRTFVQCMLKDQEGFMWFGTNRGLYKFDGREYRIYKKQYNDDNSVSDNDILCLFQDATGKLWIGTRSGGISVLNLENEIFKHYRNDSDNDGVPENIWITKILGDSEGNIWVTSNGNGIGKFDPKTDGFVYFKHDKTNPKSLHQDYVTFIQSDGDKRFWIGLNGKGFDLFDTKQGVFQHFLMEQLPEQRMNFRNNVVRDMTFLNSGKVLTATFGGINVWNLKTKQVKHFDSQTNSGLGADSFNNIFKLGNTVFIVSFYGLVYRFDEDTQAFQLAYKTENDIISSYKDNEGNLWLGMAHGMVEYFKTDNPFGFQKSLPQNAMARTMELLNGELLIGTSNGFFDSTGKPYPSNGQLGNKQIICSQLDADGKLWVGTNSNGVLVWDTNANTLEQYRYTPGNNTGLSHDTVLDIHHDAYGTTWVSTNYGLNQWLPESEGFHARGRSVFRDVLRVSKEELWCASNHGVVVSNLETGKYLTRRSSLEVQTDSILHNEVLALYSPDRDSIFIGSQGGLNLFVKSKNQMLDLHQILGMPYVSVEGVVQDQHKNYWATTSQGVLHFDLTKKTFRFLNKSDALDFVKTDLGNNILFDETNNQMFIGGYGGYYQFTPKPNIPKETAIAAKITNIILPNNLNKALQKNHVGNENGRPTLEAEENTISFAFTGIDFNKPEQVQYRYRMLGIQKQWTYTENRSATFANLDPGEYTFEVQASTDENTWPQQTASFGFYIKTPLWASWWAYLSYTLIVLGIMYYFLRSFLTRQKLKTQLRLEHLEVEKVQELSNLKSKFFANVSHEFRTPLTLIQGPVNDLLQNQHEPAVKENLKLVQNNTQRLQRLINQLLDYAKVSENRLSSAPTEVDVFAHIRAVIGAFDSWAKEKDIQLHFTISIKHITALLDIDALESILNNLVSNAIKYSAAGESVWVQAQTNETNSTLQLCVKDTGKGLSKEEKELVFQRFYRTDENLEGTGIGLSLTKELVDGMGGEIQVKDNHPKGSVFEVSIPLVLVQESAKPPQVESNTMHLPFGTLQEEHTILLVEDHQELQQYIQKMMQPYGHVIVAKNGMEALQIAVQTVPDLIISDFMMPLMDGGELCRNVRKDAVVSHIPFIMLTAKATEEDKILGLRDGATDYIFKPFDKQELTLKVANLLRQRKRLQEKLKHELFHEQSSKVADSQDARFLEKFKDLVLQYLDKSDLTVDFLSRHMGMSRVQLYRKLMALTGVPASDFIRNIRLQKSAKLIKNNWGNISEIAYEVGFNNLSYFTKCFKETFGMTPSQFAKS
ncbi:MAG: ATP-binding protein [Bacteroidota bacterium]